MASPKERAASLRAELPGTDGVSIPRFGLGTWMGRDKIDDRVSRAVECALKFGYRHIDTAAIYQDEEQVGKGIRSSGVPRSEIFITTKLWNEDQGQPKAALEKSLERLGTDYIDLWLMHWPYNGAGLPIADVWQSMKKVQEETGKVKAIGVCNFTKERLSALIKETGIKPSLLQVELHPWLQQDDLLAYCKQEGIAVTAYMPFGNLNRWDQNHLDNMLVDDPTLVAIAKDMNITVPQLLVSWALQRGTIVIPKSVHEERIHSNFAYFPLSDEVMAKIAKMDKGQRFCDPSDGWKERMFA